MHRIFFRIGRIVALGLFAVVVVKAQSGEPEQARNANARKTTNPAVVGEPFDGATVEKMASQCVTLETEVGAIEIGFMPETAPEAVRNFLNLSATGAFDTTTFSRTVK